MRPAPGSRPGTQARLCLKPWVCSRPAHSEARARPGPGPPPAAVAYVASESESPSVTAARATPWHAVHRTAVARAAAESDKSCLRTPGHPAAVAAGPGHWQPGSVGVTGATGCRCTAHNPFISRYACMVRLQNTHKIWQCLFLRSRIQNDIRIG